MRVKDNVFEARAGQWVQEGKETKLKRTVGGRERQSFKWNYKHKSI